MNIECARALPPPRAHLSPALPLSLNRYTSPLTAPVPTPSKIHLMLFTVFTDTLYAMVYICAVRWQSHRIAHHSLEIQFKIFQFAR